MNQNKIKYLEAYSHGWQATGNSLCFLEKNEFLIDNDVEIDCEKLSEYDVQIDEYEDKKEVWAFFAGVFDSCGYYISPDKTKYEPICGISTGKDEILTFASSIIKIPYTSNFIDKIEWKGNNALDFLGRIYENSPVKRKAHFSFFQKIATWFGTDSFCNFWRGNPFQFARTREDAIAPFKTRASDSGYDLTLLELVKTVGDVEFYETGIKVKPNFGFYFDLVPRSSMSKTGYMLANSVGIIDRAYTDSIKVALRKVNQDSKPIELPARIVQIIPRQIMHIDWLEVSDIEDTDRGIGGFGSTNY